MHRFFIMLLWIAKESSQTGELKADEFIKRIEYSILIAKESSQTGELKADTLVPMTERTVVRVMSRKERRIES